MEGTGPGMLQPQQPFVNTRARVAQLLCSITLAEL